MRNRYVLATLLVVLPILACAGGEPHVKPSPLLPSSPSPDMAELGIVAYICADSLDDIPEPESIFGNALSLHGSGDTILPEPAFIWRQDDEIIHCYLAQDGKTEYCYQLASDTNIGASKAGAQVLVKLFRKVFDKLSRLGKRGGKTSRASPTPPPPTASASKHLLTSVEAWRKPVLTTDKQIYPYGRTRGSASPIQNVGLDRAGKTISDGKHAISFDQNGFPRFNTKFETLLDDTHIGTSNRRAHIKVSNEALHKAIQKDPGLARDLGLSVDDVAALPKSHQAPTGYRWHHHQDVGRMQFVKFEEHRLATPHTGGMRIWGGGYQ